MKKSLSVTTLFVIPVVVILLVARLCEKDAPIPAQSKVRILTYNVHLCVGVDGMRDYQRVADVILRIDPDIVALQELDSATIRSNGDITLEELASRTNMYFVYGPFFEYEGGKYGIGILSKKKPLNYSRL